MIARPPCLSLALILALGIALPAHATHAAHATQHARPAPATSTAIHRVVVKPSRTTRPSHQRASHDDGASTTQASTPSQRGTHDRQHVSASPATRTAEHRTLLRLLERQERAQQREQAAAAARAAHIYAVSQTNAPILADTRACKRTGAHGESIYENCALTSAAQPPR
ncbi:MAG: hypothetical protein JSR34_06875 [Proteobacteria bacterium]|nr:hypothetical protein [Pseudomonadota bacterium]